MIFGFPNAMWMVLTGIFFMGFFAAFLFVPVTPEIIEAVTLEQKTKWRKALRNSHVDENIIEEKVSEKYALISSELVDKASAL